MHPLILYIGNPNRGDDGAGWWLYEAMVNNQCHKCPTQHLWLYQLSPENAYEFETAARICFVDASIAFQAGIRWYQLTPANPPQLDSHGLAPASLLALYESLWTRQAPPAWMLEIGATHFGLTEQLSAQTRTNLDAAQKFLLDFLNPAPTDYP